jgi:phosphate acetyltransferase
MDVLLQIKREARKSPARIIFCEPKDSRIISAIRKIKQERIAEPILLNESVEKNLQRASEMLDIGEADGIVTGASHPSKLTFKLAIQLGTQSYVNRISSGNLLVRGRQVLYFSDCAVNVNPTAAHLAEIGLLAQKTFEQLTKIKPLTALLSYSTLGSAEGESVSKVRRATNILKKRKKNVKGEVQLDSALYPEIYNQKTGKKGSSANVLIFPNLDAGNIGVKLAQRLGGFRSVGPILQGVKYPINDLSRGCSVDDIVDLTAITSVQNESSNN